MDNTQFTTRQDLWVINIMCGSYRSISGRTNLKKKKLTTEPIIHFRSYNFLSLNIFKGYYNSKRPHGTLRMLTPNEIENLCWEASLSRCSQIIFVKKRVHFLDYNVLSQNSSVCTYSTS